MQFMETSSKTGNSVDAVFELVAEESVRSELTRRGTLRSRVRKLRRRNRHPAGVTGGRVVSVDDGSDPTSGGCWQWLNRIPARIGPRKAVCGQHHYSTTVYKRAPQSSGLSVGIQTADSR